MGKGNGGHLTAATQGQERERQEREREGKKREGNGNGKGKGKGKKKERRTTQSAKFFVSWAQEPEETSDRHLRASDRKTMKEQLRRIPFRSPADKGWEEADTLYRAAFPAKEIRSAEDHLRALQDPLYKAEGIWLDERFAGLLYYWEFGDSRYIEHLAVDPALRGRHIGSDVLAVFCRGKRVILEIDPPENPVALRRLHFYERLGFVSNPQLFLHPSFRKPFETHRLVLMSYPSPLEHDEARAFADFVRERVLRYSEHDAPELPRLE